MPEINGITQVDIPGLMAAYGQAKRQRLEDLYLKQKMDREDAAVQKEAAIAEAYRGAIKRRTPPSQGSAVSSDLIRLSQLGRGGEGQGGGVASAVGLSATGGIASMYLSGSPAPAAPPAGPAAVPPNPAPQSPLPDMPHPPAHLLPDTKQGDDGIDFSPGLTLDPEGLYRLAALDPKAAYELQKMDDDARARAFKRISEDVEFTGRIIGAVRAAPEDQRQARYQQIRADMAARGFRSMPERWDEAQADTLQRMGLTAMQAFQDDRAERKFQHDVDDDEADNARADRNTDSVISDRNARRGLIARGQDLTDARGRRGQDIESTDRRRGQDITDKRVRETGGGKGHHSSQSVVDVQTPEQARQLKPGTVFRTPDGRVKVR